MSGMRTSFLSAAEPWCCSPCASARMGRYSESALCCAGQREPPERRGARKEGLAGGAHPNPGQGEEVGEQAPAAVRGRGAPLQIAKTKLDL